MFRQLTLLAAERKSSVLVQPRACICMRFANHSASQNLDGALRIDVEELIVAASATKLVKMQHYKQRGPAAAACPC